jgi:hypothetical protein
MTFMTFHDFPHIQHLYITDGMNGKSMVIGVIILHWDGSCFFMGLHIISQHRSSSMARRSDGAGRDMCW